MSSRLTLSVFDHDETGQPITLEQCEGLTAYENWCLWHHYRDISACHDFIDGGTSDAAAIPRPDKNLVLYLLLQSNPRIKTIAELGSTLFEMIDGLCATETLYERLGIETAPTRVSDLSFIGSERSNMLRRASQQLHQSFDVSVFSDLSNYTGSYDLLYDRCVSCVAFDDPKDAAQLINRSDMAFLNLFVSLEDTFHQTRAADTFTYFSLADLIDGLDKQLYHVYGYASPGSAHKGRLSKPSVEGFFLYCEKDVAERFSRMITTDPVAGAFLQGKEAKVRLAAELFNHQVEA